MKSLVIGTSSVDTLIHVGTIDTWKDDLSLWPEHMYETIGSTGAGKAYALDVLGSNVTFLTDVGEDQYKTKIQSFFANTNIHMRYLPTNKSMAHTNIMHSGGKRITVTTSQPEDIPPVPSDIQELIDQTDVIFLNINEFCRDYIPYIKPSGKPILVDIHDYDEKNPYHKDFIDAATILVASEINIQNHQQFMTKQIDAGKELVIITKGAKGLVAMDAKYITYQLPGYNDFEYVDSNGAGDSFCAGFLLEYWNTNSIEKGLKFGTVCGGLACSSETLYHPKFDQESVRKIVAKMDWNR